MSTEGHAQELVVGCLAATAVVAAGSSLASGELPGMRMVIGLSFTGVGLAAGAMFAPDIAGGLAALILVSSLFVYGTPLLDAITTLTSSPKVSPSLAPLSNPSKGTLNA